MKEIVDKLIAVEREATDEKGGFTLFALFLREDAADSWDLLAAAPWLETDRKEGFRYLVGKLTSRLDRDELALLSRVVVLDRRNPGLEALHRVVRAEHGAVEIDDRVFFGMRIAHAYIITSRWAAEGSPQPQTAADAER